MRRAIFSWSLVVILASVLPAQKREKDPTAGFPRVILNARFVYVTSFTGGQFNTSTYPGRPGRNRDGARSAGEVGALHPGVQA